MIRSSRISLLPAALGGAVLGFLIYNWHPAKIILGDAGAYFLGLALAVAAIIGGAKIATTLLALGLPILDVAWVAISRAQRGTSVVQADRGHLHHRLLDLGWSQAQDRGVGRRGVARLRDRVPVVAEPGAEAGRDRDRWAGLDRDGRRRGDGRRRRQPQTRHAIAGRASR